jgi:predicted RND superfamily exporter protein
MTINGDLLQSHIDYVTGAVQAFLPLIAVISGVFVAFAIINLLRFTIVRLVR